MPTDPNSRPGPIGRYYQSYKSGHSSNNDPYIPQPFHKTIARRFCLTKRDARIVDLGCGRGGLVRYLSEMGFTDVQGIDFSESQVAARVTELVQFGNIFNFLDLSADQSFDCVFLLDVLEHLRRDDALRLGESLARTLSPNGILILHVPNASGIFGARVRYADITHETAFTPESLLQWALASGFESVECYEDKPIVHGPMSFIRRVIYEVFRLPALALWSAETGMPRAAILSMGMTACIRRSAITNTF